MVIFLELIGFLTWTNTVDFLYLYQHMVGFLCPWACGWNEIINSGVLTVQYKGKKSCYLQQTKHSLYNYHISCSLLLQWSAFISLRSFLFSTLYHTSSFTSSTLDLQTPSKPLVCPVFSTLPFIILLSLGHPSAYHICLLLPWLILTLAFCTMHPVIHRHIHTSTVNWGRFFGVRGGGREC